MEDALKRSIIKNREIGADISLIDVIYIKSRKDPQTGRYGSDYIYIIYRDNVTKKSHIEIIENPTYTYYVATESQAYNRIYIEADKVRPVTCKYRDLRLSIAKETDNVEWYKDCCRSGNYKETIHLFDHPSIFGADINIEDYYRILFGELYTNEVYIPTKLYFDIEVNIRDMPKDQDFPEYGQYPVDAITVIADEPKKMYTLLLEDPRNPSFLKFKETQGVTQMLYDRMVQHVGGQKRLRRLGLDGYSYQVYFFDDEIKMIQTFFDIVNLYRPNIATAWNLPFDLNYLSARIQTLGFNPAEIMSHRESPIKYFKYYIDRKAKRPEQRGDYAQIASYTVFIDQLITFASRRKGQRLVKNNKLDTVAQIFAGIRKQDYSEFTHNLAMLSSIDYFTYVLYNFCDVICQVAIEHMTADFDFVVAKSLTNNTRYAKVHRQTVYLPNRGATCFEHDGYIIGNNINKYNRTPEERDEDDEEDDDSFTGAIVLDPLNLTDKPKLKLNGRSIMVCDNCVDYDASSLYPSNIEENNMSPETMIGKILFDEPIDPNEDRFSNDKFDRSVAFIEDLLSGNVLDFCMRYFGLPSYERMYDLIIEYFHSITNPSRGLRVFDSLTGKRFLYHTVDNQQKRQLYSLVDNTQPRMMTIITERMPEYDKSKFKTR